MCPLCLLGKIKSLGYENIRALNCQMNSKCHGRLTDILQCVDFKDSLAKKSSEMAFVKKVFYVAAVLGMLQVFCRVETQQCRSERREASQLGMMLQRHIFKRMTEPSYICLKECYRDVRCQSFNYVISKEMCELNNRTKEARPEDFVPNSDRYYFKRDMGRGN